MKFFKKFEDEFKQKPNSAVHDSKNPYDSYNNSINKGSIKNNRNKKDDDKLNSFFYIFQKLVRHNIITNHVYIIIIIIEYLQLFYQLTNNNEDYIVNPSEELKSNSSFIVFKSLQLINYLTYLSNDYLSYTQFLIVYVCISFLLTFNFLFLYLLDYLNKKWVGEKSNFTTIYSILGFFNYINMKILIMPTNYVLLRSLSIESYYSNSSMSSSSTMNNTSTDSSGSLISNVETVNNNFFDIYILKIISVAVLLINIINLTQNSLLFNDIDPLKSRLCWAQSYPEIEMYNIILKVGLSILNYIGGDFFFIKSLFVLMINIMRCSYRFSEWYYSWSTNKIILIILDFGFFSFNIFSLLFSDSTNQIAVLISILLLSSVIGFLFYLIIEDYQNEVFSKPLHKLKTEWEYCVVIIKLISIIKEIIKEKKSIYNSLFYGFLTQHNKCCLNDYHCFSKTILSFINKEEANILLENENIKITRHEFSIYLKIKNGENVDIITDSVRIKCEKLLYSVVKCIIILGINKFKKPKFLPILEAHLYLHIFDNTFYALFQITKYYKSNLPHREKFFYFTSLSHVLEKMMEKSSENIFDVSQASDFYYYHEDFVSNLFYILNKSEDLLISLLKSKTTAVDVLFESTSIGFSLERLFYDLEQILKLNSLEVSLLRVFSFVVDKLFEMKSLSNRYYSRLTSSIRSLWVEEDSLKNLIRLDIELLNKNIIKTFKENSASAVVIVSGAIETIGKIIYVNELASSILGYEKQELINSSINSFLPTPLAIKHDSLIIEFYKTGKASTLDKLSSTLIKDKRFLLRNNEMFMCFMPNFKFGITFVALIKKKEKYQLTKEEVMKYDELLGVDLSFKKNAILVLDQNLDIMHMNEFGFELLNINKQCAYEKLPHICRYVKSLASLYTELLKGNTYDVFLEKYMFVSSSSSNVMIVKSESIAESPVNKKKSGMPMSLRKNSDFSLTKAIEKAENSNNQSFVKSNNSINWKAVVIGKGLIDKSAGNIANNNSSNNINSNRNSMFSINLKPMNVAKANDTKSNNSNINNSVLNNSSNSPVNSSTKKKAVLNLNPNYMNDDISKKFNPYFIRKRTKSTTQKLISPTKNRLLSLVPMKKDNEEMLENLKDPNFILRKAFIKGNILNRKNNLKQVSINLFKKTFTNLEGQYYVLLMRQTNMKKNKNINKQVSPSSAQQSNNNNNNSNINIIGNENSNRVNISNNKSIYSDNSSTDSINSNNNNNTMNNYSPYSSNAPYNKLNANSYNNNNISNNNSNNKANDFDEDKLSILANETKKQLIENKYTPSYASFSNKTVFIVTVIIIVWVVFTYILEIIELDSIESKISLTTYSKNIAQTYNYIIINTLLYLRTRSKPFNDVSYLTPLLKQSLSTDLIFIKEQIDTLHELSVEYDSKLIIEFFNEHIFDIVEESMFVNSNNKKESLNPLLAFYKALYNVNMILHDSSVKSNYYDSDVKEFDSSISEESNNFITEDMIFNDGVLDHSDFPVSFIDSNEELLNNIVELESKYINGEITKLEMNDTLNKLKEKYKIDNSNSNNTNSETYSRTISTLNFLAYNHFISYLKLMRNLNTNVNTTISNAISNSKLKTYLIFSFSLIFCVIVVIIIWWLLLKQEQYKQTYLDTLEKIPLDTVISKIQDIVVFKESFEYSLNNNINILVLKGNTNKAKKRLNKYLRSEFFLKDSFVRLSTKSEVPYNNKSNNLSNNNNHYNSNKSNSNIKSNNLNIISNNNSNSNISSSNYARNNSNSSYNRKTSQLSSLNMNKKGGLYQIKEEDSEENYSIEKGRGFSGINKRNKNNSKVLNNINNVNKFINSKVSANNSNVNNKKFVKQSSRSSDNIYGLMYTGNRSLSNAKADSHSFFNDNSTINNNIKSKKTIRFNNSTDAYGSHTISKNTISSKNISKKKFFSISPTNKNTTVTNKDTNKNTSIKSILSIKNKQNNNNINLSQTPNTNHLQRKSLKLEQIKANKNNISSSNNNNKSSTPIKNSVFNKYINNKNINYSSAVVKTKEFNNLSLNSDSNTLNPSNNNMNNSLIFGLISENNSYFGNSLETNKEFNSKFNNINNSNSNGNRNSNEVFKYKAKENNNSKKQKRNIYNNNNKLNAASITNSTYISNESSSNKTNINTNSNNNIININNINSNSTINNSKHNSLKSKSTTNSPTNKASIVMNINNNNIEDKEKDLLSENASLLHKPNSSVLSSNTNMPFLKNYDKLSFIVNSKERYMINNDTNTHETSTQKKKNFSNYKINFKSSFFKFIVLLILITSYFLASLYNFSIYFSNLNSIIHLNQELIDNLQLSNVVLIKYYYTLLYQSKYLTTTEYNANSSLSLDTLIKMGFEKEESNIHELKKCSFNDNLIQVIEYYNVIGNLCNDFNSNTKADNEVGYSYTNSLNITINVDFVLINCNDVVTKSLSFERIDLLNYVSNKQLDVIIKNNGSNYNREYFRGLYKEKKLANYLISSGFFKKHIESIIYKTFINGYLDYFDTNKSILIILFVVYLFIIFCFMLIFHFYMIPNIIKSLNNLTRVGLFFNYDNFDIFVSKSERKLYS